MKFETACIPILGDDFAAVAVVVNVLKEEIHLLPILLKSNTRDVFEAVQNTHSTWFKHYLKQLQNRSRAACIVSPLGYETGAEHLLKFLNQDNLR